MIQEFQIPAGSAHWIQRVVLDDEAYYISVRWNPRIDRWFFSLADSLQQPIVEGRKMLPGRDLLAGIAAEGRPPGTLMVIDWSQRGLVPNEANFDGQTVGLVYFTVDE